MHPACRSSSTCRDGREAVIRRLRGLFIHERSERPSRAALILNIIGIGVVLFFIFRYGFAQLSYTFRWDSVWRYRSGMAQGFLMTILISLASLGISALLGLFFALAQSSRIIALRLFSRLYIEVIRGTPLLVQILIFFYVIANAAGLDNRYVAGVVIMSIFSGAYIAEIIRAGIESVGSTQRETARSIGLTRSQTYRFIIFPQVVTRVLPPLAGQFASLIKDSSLLSIIAIKEFTMAAREINANTFSTLESYIPLAIGYLVLTVPISYLTKRLERKYRYET